MPHYSEKMKWWQIVMAITFFISIYVGSFYVAHIIGANSNDGAHNVAQAEDVIEYEKEPFVAPEYGANVKPGNPERIILEDDLFYIEGITDKIILEDDEFEIDAYVELPFISFNE